MDIGGMPIWDLWHTLSPSKNSSRHLWLNSAHSQVFWNTCMTDKVWYSTHLDNRSFFQDRCLLLLLPFYLPVWKYLLVFLDCPQKPSICSFIIFSRRLPLLPMGNECHQEERRKCRKNERIENLRTHFLQKKSTEIVKNHDIIDIEDLSVREWTSQSATPIMAGTSTQASTSGWKRKGFSHCKPGEIRG